MIAGAGTFEGRYSEVSMDTPAAVLIVRTSTEFAEAATGEIEMASNANATSPLILTLQR
jgi:hypothetical protein